MPGPHRVMAACPRESRNGESQWKEPDSCCICSHSANRPRPRSPATGGPPTRPTSEHLRDLHATRIPGLEQLTSAGDYLGWSRPSCQRRRKRRPESRTSLKNFRRRTLDAFGAREPNLLRDATALSCLVLAFCPCRLFYALINLPVFDPGRGESVVLLALPDVCVIFGINSVDFCNIGQFRVML